MRILLVCLSLIQLLSFSSIAHSELIKVDYTGFTVWLDCEIKSPVQFRYIAQRDTGNLKRKANFNVNPRIPKHCQQRSTFSYRKKGERYDRGHMVPANHLDHDPRAIAESNFMSNITPQAANMNRGAWYQTEKITECYRDIDELLILGGAVHQDSANDFFIKSHGVPTAEYFWKVIIRNERVIAWYIPNSQEAVSRNLDKYLISVRELEKLIGKDIPVSDYLKDDVPSQSWLIPLGCNWS
jgi:endonuclease G